mmetsp:Transcript_36730/g.56993  ORF Transcript_36730/g.56993 Transcript_36730/m.56993 type:complete len:184 (-) Transcript_36730:13-564(-)
MRRNYNTNSKVMELADLQPEQRRVFDVLTQNFKDWEKQCTDYITEEILLSGAAYFCESPVTMDSIPKGNDWCWRQSNARISVKLDVSSFATMIKLNTKKKNKSSPKPPSYKFWIVQIEQPYQQHIWFLYCEKGMDSLSLPQAPVETFPVDLSDLSFLQQFMSPADIDSIFAFPPTFPEFSVAF